MLPWEKSKNRDKISLETFVQHNVYYEYVRQELGQAGWLGKGHRTLPESAIPWLPPLSPISSCIKTLRINVCYWREKVPGSYSVSQAFPCILSLDMAPHHIYGLPASEYPGLMKVSYWTTRGPCSSGHSYLIHVPTYLCRTLPEPASLLTYYTIYSIISYVPPCPEA